MLAAFFAVTALIALAGLSAVALHAVPRVLGTTAFILTLAALGVAVLR